MVTSVLLPVALGILMLGLGLSLTPADFRRAAKHPRIVLIALACQLILLPLACFAMVLALDVPGMGPSGPYLAAGLMLLAASPGGATASLFSHLFRGDVALNVTILAIDSVLAVVTVPLIVNLSFAYFLTEGAQIGLQFGDTLQVFAVVLLPVLIGMAVRRRLPDFARRMDRPVRIASILILVAVVIGALILQGHEVYPYLGTMGGVAVLFCLINLTVGYVVPRLLRVRPAQSIAVSMEIGVHNEILAITIALSVLHEPRLAVPAATYSILKFAIIPVFGWVITRSRAFRADTSDPAVPVTAQEPTGLPG